MSPAVAFTLTLSVVAGLAGLAQAVWPLPSSAGFGTADVAVEPSPGFFVMKGGAAPPRTLALAFARYQALTFPHHTSAADAKSADAKGIEGLGFPAITSLVLDVGDLDESHPQLGHNETYALDIGYDGALATLAAPNIYAAMHGLETFSQIVQFDFTTETYHVLQAPVTITDTPRFPHRGLMIDSARHFETLASIRNIIDSLPYAKINVLHWHAVDTQSFPFEVKKYPALRDAGAYSAVEKFSQLDIADIVEYARLRGVRVMVEFDVPGHAQSWCKGVPDICPSATCLTPLNVANPKTFDVIGEIISECTGGHSSTRGNPAGLFPDNMIHLGGDEVNTACWSSTKSIATWLADKNMTADGGYAYFVQKVGQLAIANGRRPVQWSEVYDHFKTDLDKKTIVHVWKAVTNVTEVVANGYDTIVNVGYDSNSWYLDNLNVNWSAVYANDPCAGGMPDDLCAKHVLGGHGEMWGETVDTSDLAQTVWPRLAAISERLWSPKGTTDAKAALPRIEAFRCLLNRRGIAAAPVNNKNARTAPSGPGSCLQQRR
jgi:hexosaminidase